jgi:hypothetical protein
MGCTQDNFALCLYYQAQEGCDLTLQRPQGGRGGALRVVVLRGSAVIDKSFVIMALACAMAPIVGAGIYIVVYLF